MFCTLKVANVAGEPYAFEATPPPFSKKREGKTSKVACTNCRTSKVCRLIRLSIFYIVAKSLFLTSRYSYGALEIRAAAADAPVRSSNANIRPRLGATARAKTNRLTCRQSRRRSPPTAP